jgi:hypothetical protein
MLFLPFQDAVIRMLTIAEKNDLDDDDDMELPESKKSKKSASKKHIVTGSDLGATLTQRKIQRWKVLLLDSFTQKMLQPLLNVGDLRALGVTLIMNVKDKRQPIIDAPAIYFIQPTKANIDIICKDCENDLYDSCYVNFSSTVPRELLEDMAQQLVKADATNKISRIHDQFLNFVCYEQSFYSIEMKNCLAAVSHEIQMVNTFSA